MRYWVLFVVVLLLPLVNAQETPITCFPFKDGGNATIAVNEPFCVLSQTKLTVKGYSGGDFTVVKFDAKTGYIFIYNFKVKGMAKLTDLKGREFTVNIYIPEEKEIESEIRKQIDRITEENKKLKQNITILMSENEELKEQVSNLTTQVKRLEAGACVETWLKGKDVEIYLEKKAAERKSLDIFFTSLAIVAGIVGFIMLVRWYGKWRYVGE